MGDRREASWTDRTACAVLRPFRGRTALILATPAVLLVAPIVVVALCGFLNVVLPKPLVAALLVLGSGSGILMYLAVARALSLARKLQEAHDREDIDEIVRIRRIMEGDPEKQGPFGRANAALGDAELLLGFERWAEARDAFARLDVGALPEATRPIVASEHGYAVAHAGEPDRGVGLLEDALRSADARTDYPVAKRWCIRARLGAALALAGRHDDAIDVLAPLLDEDDCSDLRVWTMAMFFYAQSLRAAGAMDDAMLVYEQIEQGEGPFVARAKAAFDLARGAPLRIGGGAPIANDDSDDGVEGERVADKLRRALGPPGRAR